MALRRRIQAGELGQIWSARCDTFLAAAPTDNLASGRPRQGWRGFDGKRGGGGVVDVTVPSVGRNGDCRLRLGQEVQALTRCHGHSAIGESSIGCNRIELRDHPGACRHGQAGPLSPEPAPS